MTDYSRAENSKNHRNSFKKMAQSIKTEIEKLESKYETTWNKAEQDRKELASSIEDSIKILKQLKIKTDKPLNQYKRDQVPGILLKIAKTISEEFILLRDQLIENAKTIESRFKFINTKSAELDHLEDKLADYYVKEEDYDEEVTISLADYKKQKEESQKKAEEEEKAEKQTITQDLRDLVKSTFRVVSDEEEEETDFARLKIDKDYSLEDLAYQYYENSEYWITIYNFGENKLIIDQLCKLYDMTLDEFKSKKNILKGFELCFPDEITIYEGIQKNNNKKAA